MSTEPQKDCNKPAENTTSGEQQFVEWAGADGIERPLSDFLTEAIAGQQDSNITVYCKGPKEEKDLVNQVKVDLQVGVERNNIGKIVDIKGTVTRTEATSDGDDNIARFMPYSKRENYYTRKDPRIDAMD